MKLPSTINKTAYFAVTTFSNIKAQHDFLTQYGYAENEMPNLIRAASNFFKLQQNNVVTNSPPRKPKQAHTPHTTKK
jgi:hypothetical protein